MVFNAGPIDLIDISLVSGRLRVLLSVMMFITSESSRSSQKTEPKTVRGIGRSLFCLNIPDTFEPPLLSFS